MTMAELLAAWPQVQTVLRTQGIDLPLPAFLGLYQALAPVFAHGSSPPPPSLADAPMIPLILELGADGNNAPYGVTLAGWSPQSHQGADLRDAKNAKYIVYAYLVTNRVPPTRTWATDAVPVLQRVVPDVPWTAGDTETLIFGDEFVHPAPNGHGMAAGTFNPNAAREEFFWGTIG